MSTTVYGPLKEFETGTGINSNAPNYAERLNLHNRIQAQLHALERNAANSHARSEGKQTTGNRGATAGGTAPLPPQQVGLRLNSEPKTQAERETLKTDIEGGKAAGAGGTDAQSGGIANPLGPSKMALEVAGPILGWIKEALGADIVKALLYVLLAGGGAALVVTGVSRAAGLHPAQAAKNVGKVAAAGAVVA
jgi:hypothetical protein